MTWFNVVAKNIHKTTPWLTHLPIIEEPTILTTIATSMFRIQDENPFFGSGTKRKMEVRHISTSFEPNRKRIKRGFDETCFSWGERITVVKGKPSPCLVDFRKSDAKLAEVEAKIEYQVKCRLWTYFNLLCLYSGEKCRISISQTVHQNGGANCGCCHAAHFSILPSLKDTFLEDLAAEVAKTSINDEIIRKCKLLGIIIGDKDELLSELKQRLEYQPDRGKEIRNLIELIKSEGLSVPVKNKCSLLGVSICSYQNLPKLLDEIKVIQKKMYSDSSFMNIISNDTVKIPAVANRYDCLLEGSIRQIAVQILNAIAGNPIDKKKEKGFNDETDLPQPDDVKTPYDGMVCFVSWMHSFYKRSEKSIKKKQEFLKELLTAEMNLEKIAQDYRGNKVSFKEFLAAIEQVKKQKDLVEDVSCYAPSIKVDKRLSAWIKIIDQIDSWMDEEKEKVKNGQEAQMVQKWDNWLGKSASAARRSDAQLMATNLKKNSKSVMNQLFKDYTLYELLEIFGRIPALENLTKSVMKENVGWKPLLLDEDKYTLDASMKVLNLQRHASVTPKKQELFYDIANEKNIDKAVLHAKRLLVQKINLDALYPEAEAEDVSDSE